MKAAGSIGCVPSDLSVHGSITGCPGTGCPALGPSLDPSLGPSQTEACLVACRTLVGDVDLHAITGFPCSQLCSGSCPGQRKLWKFHAPEIQETRFAGDFFHTSISFQRGIRSTFAIARWLKMITFSFCPSSNCLQLLCWHSFLPLLKTSTYL